MKNKIKVWKEKFLIFIEKARMPNAEYLELKNKLTLYENIFDAFEIQYNVNSVTATDKQGNIIKCNIKTSNVKLIIDVKKFFDPLEYPFDPSEVYIEIIKSNKVEENKNGHNGNLDN